MNKRITNILTLVLIVMIVFSIKGTAYSMEKASMDNHIMDSYYRTVEREYTDNIKLIANQMGYSNAGVMLTKIVNASGNRVYTLALNHKGFGKADANFEEFLRQIKAVDIGIDKASILIETTY